MISKGEKNGEHLYISRFRWVIGAPYFVQGTSTLTEIPILYFINFQWAVLALANAGSVYLGGLLQQRIQQDVYEPWLVFLLTGIPPLVTAAVGIRNIEDERTLILQMFVYISLFFTLLAIPFIGMLRRELDRRGVKINLGKRSHAA